MQTKVLTVKRCMKCFLDRVAIVWAPIEPKRQKAIAKMIAEESLKEDKCACKKFAQDHGNAGKCNVSIDCPYWLEICMEKQC